jgi:hypothetical protein
MSNNRRTGFDGDLAMQKKSVPSLLALILLLSLACSLGTPALDPMSQTLTPMNAAVEETLTARANEVGSAGDDLATAVVEATAKSQVIYTTQTARASLNDASRLATATVIAPVVAELPRYGVDASQGYVAWLHQPVEIALQGYQQMDFANDYPQITAKDFVIASDIQWNTKNSMSGCGFMFRSNGDRNNPSQYMVIITRFASGHAAFTALVDGEIANFHDFFPKTEDSSFSWKNDATNRLAVVAKGPMIYIYTNGVLVGEVDTTQPPPDMAMSPPSMDSIPGADQLDDYQDQVSQYGGATDIISGQLAAAKRNFAKTRPFLTDGLLGFLGLSQSGTMECMFSDSWLFILNE